MIKMSVSPECDLMMTGLLELIACLASTNSLKSASSCVDIRLCMELRSDIDNRWQYPSVAGNSLLFSVNLILSFCYQ